MYYQLVIPIMKTCPCNEHPLTPRVPTIYVLSKNKNKITFFHLKITFFTIVKYFCILHGHICVMLHSARKGPETSFTAMKWAATWENRSSGFPTRSHTNRAVQPQKMARDLKFRFRKQRDCTIRVAKTKSLISFAVTAKLICVFVFAYAKIRFSHVAAQIVSAPCN